MRIGDLLRARDKIQVGVVRIYTDDQCDSWETHVKKGETFVLLDEHQNSWKQDVCKVLFPVEFVGFIVWMLRWWNEKRNPRVLGLNP